MKTLPYSTFVFACISLLSFKSSGQDYIITQKNDTVFCQLKRALISKVVKYRINPKGKYTSVDKTEVKEYFFSNDSTTWILKPIPETNDQVYIQWLEKGRINLYEYIETSYGYNGRSSQVYYNTYQYADKDNDTLKLIHSNGLFASNKKGKKIFERFLADNAHLLEVFDNNKDHYTLEQFVHTYNKQYLLSKNKNSR